MKACFTDTIKANLTNRIDLPHPIRDSNPFNDQCNNGTIGIGGMGAGKSLFLDTFIQSLVKTANQSVRPTQSARRIKP
ncbi:hypothetical protein C9J12_29415 [Photobacterium frigidiphilum]|uniref:Uncharacterized protein n=1 Tax=Photobacterium frigidiphilum TaxID=264736 RepID=A0A2T3J5T4_9GAMM|nr:hypothetical protein C9J12_29415 [Photobacterium frigidiphilum]